jgi:hypothetical protein
LNHLDADMELFEDFLNETTSSIDHISSSASDMDGNNEQSSEENNDFYERIVDEQLEPRSMRVTEL